MREFADIEPFLIERAVNRATKDAQHVSDLSGLAFCNGRLLTISDKNNDTIFEITLHDSRASIAPAFAIPSPPERELSYHVPANLLYRLDALHIAGRQDWEGIACHNNAIYLLSERRNSVLKIVDNTSSWLSVDWYESLYERGYLHQYNAFSEGIAVPDEHDLLLAIEREPRGLLRLRQPTAKAWRIDAYTLDDTQSLQFRAGNADVADLAIYRGALFTLERNASAVCRRNLQTLRADSCFSYRTVEDDPPWRYADSEFGIGEGLAFDEHWLYVVFDSNNLGRVRAREDRRSLLLRIPIPAEWRTTQ